MMVHKAPTTLRRQYVSKLLGFTPPAELVRARGTLTQLRDLHQPFGIYDECNCEPDPNITDIVHERSPVTSCWDFETCLPPMHFICTECCTRNDDQTRLCAERHDHGPGKPICQTAAILEAAR